jgi:hypothetical protein
MFERFWTPYCVALQQAWLVEDPKTQEHGMAVHEDIIC